MDARWIQLLGYLDQKTDVLRQELLSYPDVTTEVQLRTTEEILAYVTYLIRPRP